jgi:hypothetical protein
MSEMSLDDALRELQQELAVVPSPGFAAGVRERVSRESRHHGQAWMWLAAAAALAAVATAAIVLSRPANRVIVPDLRVAAGQTTPAPAVAVVTSPAQAIPAARSRQGHREFRRPGDRGHRESGVRSAPTFEVLIPTDQVRAVSAWLDGLKSGERSVDATPLLVPIVPIEIPLIQIELIPASHSGGGRQP